MIHTRDHQTVYLFDPWDYLGPKRKRLLSESWAGLFREHILAELPVHKLARFFTEDFGRPTKEQYSALGSLILQQMHDLTDEETVFQFSFNIQCAGSRKDTTVVSPSRATPGSRTEKLFDLLQRRLLFFNEDAVEVPQNRADGDHQDRSGDRPH